ncbi:MAG: T9SS type A sorting domain-containing protein [Sphingobacteriaceae bacterium]|nr:T9SS type A sorting domain-containing protein [Sphingobacteriaceae bacterium]
MKKLLLSIFTITSFTAFSQWSVTAVFSTGEDCFYGLGKVLASDASSNALVASSDEGATFPSSNVGVPGSGLSFGAVNGGTIYAYRNTGIYSSTTGNNWTAMTTSAMSATTEVIKDIAVISSNSVFAVTNPISGNGIKIYQLSGTTWNFKANIPVGTAPLSLCMENMNGELWIGTTTTLNIKSTNGGTSWAAANGTLSPTNWWDKYVLCEGATSTTLFFGTYGGRLFKSTDGGSTWQTTYSIATGNTISISDIYVINNNEILMGCDSGFVYTKNGGSTWTKSNLGFTYSGGVLQDPLAKVTASANYVFAATKNGKVYRRLKSEVFAGINELNLITIESKVYPNPANDFTTVEAKDLMFQKNCEVKITDVLGRDISITEMKNGKAELNLSNFSKGLYTYSVYNNRTVVSKGKLVVN